MVHSRLAPTPSGLLHIGNAYSFVLTALLVRAERGLLHLRIDDLDAERTRTEFIDDILAGIEWLGIIYDSGPRSVDEFIKKYSQIFKRDDYFKQLQSSQASVFACECTRSEILAAGAGHPNPTAYRGTCRDKKLDTTNIDFSLRLRLQEQTVSFNDLFRGQQHIDLELEMGDFILRRKGGLPSYQLVSLCEDLNNGINLIVRGEDLLASTAAQIQLARQMGHPEFQNLKWAHHPLLLDTSGKKLSKSDGSLSLAHMREQGTTPATIYSYFSELMGFKDSKVRSFEELLDATQEKGIRLSPTQRAIL